MLDKELLIQPFVSPLTLTTSPFDEEIASVSIEEKVDNGLPLIKNW